MSDEYIDRLIAEKDELTQKIDKLDVFIAEYIEFENLHYTEQHRLVNQLFVMKQYEGILTERVDLCPPTGPVEKEGFDFSSALRLLTQGNKVMRTGWNDKGLWIELQAPDAHSKMTTPYAYITGITGSKTPWVPSQSDLWAEDWVTV